MEDRNWIVVTGGSKGIGKAILEVFMNEGFDAITCARNTSELEKVKIELETKYKGRELKIITCDLSNKEDCKKFGEFVKGITPLKILVNNTGYFLPGQIQSEPEGTLESMIETNVYSAYHTTRFLLPQIKAANGHIFNICSVASITPYTNGGSYCISKYALYGMTKVLREELKEVGVRVTAILPGATYTSSWEGVALPEERFIKASDVALAIYSCWTLSKNTVIEEILLRPQLGDI